MRNILDSRAYGFKMLCNRCNAKKVELKLNWHEIDRFLTGEAWSGSLIRKHTTELADVIGPRWGGSSQDRMTAEYISNEMKTAGLDRSEIEPFEIDTWNHGSVSITLPEDNDRIIASLPFLRCKPIDLVTPLLDVGHATVHEVEELRPRLNGAIVLASISPEPFTSIEPFTARISRLADAGAAAIIAIEPKTGGRMEYANSDEWLNVGPQKDAIAVVKTSSEDGAYLRRVAPNEPLIRVSVDSKYFDSEAYNTVAELEGELYPDHHMIIAGHLDTVLGQAGGNDNT